MPASAKVTPLMYQGVSDNLLSSTSPLELMDPAFGGDFEGEFGVIVTDVPRGTPAESCGSHIILITLLNDITYREIVKTEIETKFGFLQSKPNNAFRASAGHPRRTWAALGWRAAKCQSQRALNAEPFGKPNGSEMHFSFPSWSRMPRGPGLFRRAPSSAVVRSQMPTRNKGSPV